MKGLNKDDWLLIINKMIEVTPDFLKAYVAYLTYKTLKEKDSPNDK